MRRLGGFEVDREIGHGGMGVVYLGRQPSLDRPVVLKKLRRDLTGQAGLVERFEREARAAAGLHHQNVVAVYDCFCHRGEYYIAQEYVQGRDLQSILEQLGRLPARIAALIALEIARGLEQIHDRGIIHRDLKPSNVVVGSGGDTKIADFGIALDGAVTPLTQPGVLVGSPAYMAPEQLMGERADPRSDLYSFGALFYEALVGDVPFPEASDDEQESRLRRMRRERYDAPQRRNPAIPRSMAGVIRRCLRAKPAARFASAAELRRELERCLDRPSPADSRDEVACWLWERGAFQAEEGATEFRPRRRPPSARRRRGLRRTLAAAAVLVVLDGLWVLAAGSSGHGPAAGLRAGHRAPASQVPRPSWASLPDSQGARR